MKVLINGATGARSIDRLLLLATLILCLAMSSVGFAEEAGEKPLQKFEPFLGRTWKALVDPEAGVYDVARWESALAGQAVRITHSVGDGAYGGETFVMWDRGREELVFFYFTTAGFYTTGTMWFDESGALNSREVVTGNEAGIEEVQARQEILEDGRLRVKTRMLRAGEWEDREQAVYREDPAAQVILPAE